MLKSKVKVVFGLAVMALLLYWLYSLVSIRNDAIDLKDTAADTAYKTLEQELKRSQSKVLELRKTLDSKDEVIEGLNRTTGKLSALRDDLENEVRTIQVQKEVVESKLERFNLNYTQEAMRDVEAVERATNDTILDLMQQYEAVTSPKSGSETGNR